jgi:hypothetical protein
MINLDGAYDLHVHSHPCLFPRICDDKTAVAAAAAAGLGGILLKCHHESTVSRASELQNDYDDFRVYGGIVLNEYVGGINPLAVEAALKLGAKEVWMPTIDAASAADAQQIGDPPAADPEPAQAVTSQPKLMVEKYALDRDYLEAGESATVKVTIRNTSSSQHVKNIKLSYWEESAEILPAGTGAAYYKQIAKNSSCTWSFRVTATTTAQSKPHPATITMEYEDSNGNAISASDRIILQVRQPVRLTYEEPSLPVRVTQGDTPSLSIKLMNLGKSAIYNALLKFEMPGLSSGGSVLVGTIPPGESQTGTTNFRVESEPLGQVSGTLLLSYEDEYGEHYEKEIPLSTTIEEKKEAAIPKRADTATTASKFPRWIIWTVGGALLFALICYLVTNWLKQKKQREDDDMRL